MARWGNVALKYDAIVIGGGFYGATIAHYLKTLRRFRRVLLIERAQGLLLRASYNNQARVHNGYHYPRNFTTAYRSRVNLPRFVQDYPEAIKRDLTSLYAISRNHSNVSAKQFERFCHEIGASLEPAPDRMCKLFETRLIEKVFLVEEYVFSATRLAELVKAQLDQSGVEVRLNQQAFIIKSEPTGLTVSLGDGEELLNARYIFNCTYSAINQFTRQSKIPPTPLKHEIAEMALMQVPPVLSNLGITVMDGPFFSLMPFPARGLHTLSHVRYTPHLHWNDESGIDPCGKLDGYERETRVVRMVRDAARYIPAINEARYVESLFEVKTVLLKNESNDGRPILFEKHSDIPGCFSILGGKIDNIYDVLERLNMESFDLL